MSQNDHILFYSNKCLHSKELLNLLLKDVELNKKFTKVNIDNQNIKIPPYVKSVPTAIVSVNGKPSLMVGSQIFTWYNQTHSKNVELQSIQDWDPLAMSGYSDGFSYLTNADAMKKSFSFLTDSEGIITPDERNYSNDEGGGKKSQEKTQLDNDYESLVNKRNFDVPSTMPRL
jgi:hypothetical protein